MPDRILRLFELPKIKSSYICNSIPSRSTKEPLWAPRFFRRTMSLMAWDHLRSSFLARQARLWTAEAARPLATFWMMRRSRTIAWSSWLWIRQPKMTYSFEDSLMRLLYSPPPSSSSIQSPRYFLDGKESVDFTISVFSGHSDDLLEQLNEWHIKRVERKIRRCGVLWVGQPFAGLEGTWVHRFGLDQEWLAFWSRTRREPLVGCATITKRSPAVALQAVQSWYEENW